MTDGTKQNYLWVLVHCDVFCDIHDCVAHCSFPFITDFDVRILEDNRMLNRDMIEKLWLWCFDN